MPDQPSARPLTQYAPLPTGDKALLTYEAMDNSDDIVLLLEHDGDAANSQAVVIGCNDAFRRASGHADDYLLGRAVQGLFPARGNAETLMNAIRGPGSLRTELACNRAAGGTFMLGLHLMPAPERVPGKHCFVILGRDVTAVLEARHVQDSIQRLLAKVFTSVDAAVAIVNVAGRIVMTNPRVDLLLGYKPNGLVGRNSLDLLVPASRAVVAAVVKRQIEAGGDVTHTTSVLRADGSALAVRITSVLTALGDAKQFRIITLHAETDEKPRVRSQSVGKIKLVGVEEVRATLGDRWPALKQRAMATAEVVIKRNCGPEDSYSRVDDTTFLMCFGSLSEEESSFRAAMVGREIRNRLIGEGEAPDTAYVRAVAAKVRFVDTGDTPPPNAVLLDGLNLQLERLEAEARQALADAMLNPACDLEPILGRTGTRAVASQVFIPWQLERRLACALAALPHKEADAFDQDGLLIGLAAQHAVTSMAHGDTTPVLIKINFEVFATRTSTERFFMTCARIDRRVGARLILLLSSLPPGLPRTRLQDCVNRLRPFCHGVGYQVDDVVDLPEIDLSNSVNPIVVLPVAACSVSTPPKLRQLFTSLQSRRAKVLIRDVGSDKDVAALRSLGVDMVAMRRSPA